MPTADKNVTSPVRGAALWLYRLSTWQRRQQLRHDLAQAGRFPIAILFYHRIANSHANTWSMSTNDFARQLDWLQEHFDVVSLAEAQRRIRAATNNRPTVAITFDDGYAENVQFAIPELARRELPATYFVATHFTRTGEAFPHDRAAGVPLKPNTVDELKHIAAQGFELGAHTRHHLDMGQVHSIEWLREQIVGSAEDLRSWCDVPINYFSFPTGLPANMSQLAVDVIQQAGFQGFCSAYGAWNWPGQPGVHLRRIHADPGLQSLKNWLSLDPRKLVETCVLPFAEPSPKVARAREVSLASCS